ncbi:hypothetical protein [Viscerimonas tarda]
MKRLFSLFFIFFVLVQVCQAQSKKLSIDTYLEQNFILGKWSPDKRLADPLIKESMDMVSRINYHLTKSAGLWGQLSMVFGHGSKMESGENYLNIFNNIDLDNYYLKDTEFYRRINYVPSMRIATGVFLNMRYKRWKVTPYFGAGFESLNTAKISYHLKEKGKNDVDIFSYTWGGQNPFTFLGFMTGETKFSYTIYPKRELFIGLAYRQYWSKPEFRSTREDYYRDKKKEIREKEITKGKPVNALGISIGINFRR